jgi:hypothetical protein
MNYFTIRGSRAGGAALRQSECSFLDIWVSLVWRVCRSAGAIVFSILGASSAQAALSSTTFSTTALDTMQNGSTYAWSFNAATLGTSVINAAANNQIQSFSITFTDISNADLNRNVLHLALLDSALAPSSSVLNVSPANSKAVNNGVVTVDPNSSTEYTNTFLQIPSSKNWLLAANTKVDAFADVWDLQPSINTTIKGTSYYLDTTVYSNPNDLPTSVNNTLNALEKGTIPHTPFTAGRTLTLTFTNPALIATLTSYIDNGQNLALGIVSDCPYSDTGISFCINYSVVPEANSCLPLLAILSGALGCVRPRFGRASSRS